MSKKSSNGLFILILAALLFMVLNRIPYGHLVQWPFVIVTTFVHEMGHGLSAILSGGKLVSIELYQNASGIARTQTIPGWRQALIAGGGLIAPALLGGLFIIAGKSRIASSRALFTFSVFTLLSCLLWVRSSFGLLILVPMGLLLLFVARKGSTSVQHFVIQFIGVHMLVDTFTRTLRYLFSSSVSVGGAQRHSDSAVIAQHLIGGQFMWACIIATLCLVIFYWSLRRSYLS